MSHQPARRWVFGAAVWMCVLAGCSDQRADPSSAVHLEVIAGAEQRGTAGDPLPERLAVRVLDAEGRPVPGVTVSWEIDPGEGALERTSTPTDGEGVAGNAWRLGPPVGRQVARAWVMGAPTIQFNATASPGSPIRGEITPGKDPLLVQEARPFQVSLFDRHTNAVDPGDVALSWQTEDPRVAVVDERGVVRGIGPGSTRLRVSAGDMVTATEVRVAQLAPKEGTRTVSASAVLPSGTDTSGASALTMLGGPATVRTEGFRVEVADAAPTLVLLIADDRIRGLAVVPPSASGSETTNGALEIDAASTAAALLYLMPPFGLAPSQVSGEILDLIHSIPETRALAAVIGTWNERHGQLPTPDDAQYRAALSEAYASLTSELLARGSRRAQSGPRGWRGVGGEGFGLEVSEPRLIRSGEQVETELTVRNHALRWVSLYRQPAPDPSDAAASGGGTDALLIPAAAPCLREAGSAAEWFGRCWTGEGRGDPRGSYDVTLPLAPERPVAVLSAYGPGSGIEGSGLPPEASEALLLPTGMTYVELVLGSVVAPLAGVPAAELFMGGGDAQLSDGITERARWLQEGAGALPSLDACLRTRDELVDDRCVKEHLFRESDDDAREVLANLGWELAPSLAGQSTEAERRWLEWDKHLGRLVDRTVGVLVGMERSPESPLVQVVAGPIRGDVHVGYNELIGATAISVAAEEGWREPAVYPGEMLSAGPSVRVTDRDGTPVEGAWVSWEIDPKSGRVSGSQQTVMETDAEGLATADWVLGAAEGRQSLTARLAGQEAFVEFTATVFRWTHVTTSGAHACGLGSEGIAYCWGLARDAGPRTVSEWDGPTPFAIIEGPRLTQLAAGPDHTCGLDEGGTVLCWGIGRLGRLGTGSEEARRVPTPVVLDDASFIQVTANYAHTCALTESGEAYCWGRGATGELGTGSSGPAYHEMTPTRVEGDLRFSQIVAGSAHTCALARGGQAYCWGWGVWGRLGTGSMLSEVSPAAVVTDRTFSQIASGSAHTCALTENGEAYCWGYGWEGQLGTGQSGHGYEEPAPAAVAGDLRFVQIAAGSYHTCGLTGEGAAHCWGSGPSLGAGSAGDRAVPTPVRGNQRFVQIAAGARRTCGVTVEGAAYCWGPDLSPVALEAGDALRFEPVRVAPPTR